MVFDSWEGTDFLQITNNTFYHKRFSFLTDDSLKSIGGFTIQLLLNKVLHGVKDAIYLKLIDFHQLIGLQLVKVLQKKSMV